MNIAANPHVQADQTVYLKDYQKPSFLVQSINLDIQVYDDHTIVDATLVMKRQTAGDLVLLGRDLELKSIILNGQSLQADQYQLDSEQLVIANVPDDVILNTQVIIHPESNTQLEGLYKAGDLFVTQNEPEGFVKLPFIQTVQMFWLNLPPVLKPIKNILYCSPMVIYWKLVKWVRIVILQFGKIQPKNQVIYLPV
jgi:aminopeptidase N